ncbi:Uncharacterised protein [Neisseria zoodegmatis]|uniref:Uncharacterized protein n=1 Tax=Neisseria zoodegmatis TaxID=326523 RepID=A0A378WTG7_9NEIS|nr:hypothetical protein [Neisseria zoodegmatis]SUA44610.1 Uncharacterised protein [Neisseria zoodegmatis]
MPHYIRLAILALLYNVSVPAFSHTAENAKDTANGYFPGMLIVENDFVRLQDCTRRQHYSLLPYKKYGYEAMAELISTRKSTPAKTPIYVALKGEVEYSSDSNPTNTFLVSGIESIKVGENCYIYPVPAKPDAENKVSTITTKPTTPESNTIEQNQNITEQNTPAVTEPNAPTAKSVSNISESKASVTEPKVSEAQPEVSVAEPEVSAAQPEVSAAQPEVSEAQPEVSEAQPEVSEAQPEVSEAQPEVSEAQPEVSEAQPEVSEAQPEVSEAQPEVSEAQPEVSVAEPEVSTAESTQGIVDDSSNVADATVNNEADALPSSTEEQSEEEQADNGFPVMKEPVSSGIPLPTSSIRMPVKAEKQVSVDTSPEEQPDTEKPDSADTNIDIAS